MAEDTNTENTVAADTVADTVADTTTVTEASTEAAASTAAFVPEPPVVAPTADASAPASEEAVAAKEEDQVSATPATPDIVTESTTTNDEEAVDLLDPAAFVGMVVGSGSLYGAQANKLLNDIRDGSLDYAIVATTARNGLDRAVIVGEKLFASISKLFVFNTIKKPLSWVLQAPSLSRDDLFVGNTALEIVASPMQRPGAAASVLLQMDVVFGYIIGASDFHAAFKA